MAFDRFMIAPINTGLQTNLKPWLIPDDAFESLINAYVFRGRIRKRFGTTLSGQGATNVTEQILRSRLRYNIGTTNGAGDLAGTVPGAIFEIGQMFSIGSQLYTVITAGAVQPLLQDGTTTTATYSTTNGAYNFVGAPALTIVYFYPAQPVMGLTQYEIGPINDQPAFAFDTQFAYEFIAGGWQNSVGTPTWQGDDSQFFWATNWTGIANQDTYLFVTNNNATTPAPAVTDDPIYYYDGTNWASFNPFTIVRTDGTFVATARIILPFKDRLVLLDTVEDTGGVTSRFKNRARYSINGSPFASEVVGIDSAPYAWLEPNQTNTVGAATGVAKGAGYIDAATEEEIISAEFIKDRLIVYFERSTWELAYTGNQVLPFVWQKINTELGSQSTFSTVPFDKVILTVGNTGVHACSGSNVERIDERIPTTVFDISDRAEGEKRVYGIRDYFTEMVYWTYPVDTEVSTETFPNRVLVYNYKTGSWAINTDSFTAFGYFEQQQDIVWQTALFTWQNSNATWNSGITQSQFRQVIAGNPQGFILIVNPEEDRNAPAMPITNISYPSPGIVQMIVINHTLVPGEYVAVENAQGITITPATSIIFEVLQVIDVDTIQLFIRPEVDFSGTYLGGGTLARVSNIDIRSKEWNPYVEKDRNIYVQRIDFCIERTEEGEVTIEYYTSSADDLQMIQQAQNTNMILGNNVLETRPYDINLYPLEQVQRRLWHPVYFQSEGEFIQIQIIMSDTQIRTTAIAWSPFVLEGLTLFTQPTRNRLE